MAHEKFGSDAHHHKDKRLARRYLCRDLRSDVHAKFTYLPDMASRCSIFNHEPHARYLEN